MKNFVLDYVNENEFRKLERSLKKYNMRAFKKLSFEYYPDMRCGKFPGEIISHNKDAGTITYEPKIAKVMLCLLKFMEMLNFYILYILKKQQGYVKRY